MFGISVTEMDSVTFGQWARRQDVTLPIVLNNTVSGTSDLPDAEIPNLASFKHRDRDWYAEAAAAYPQATRAQRESLEQLAYALDGPDLLLWVQVGPGPGEPEWVSLGVVRGSACVVVSDQGKALRVSVTERAQFEHTIVLESLRPQPARIPVVTTTKEAVRAAFEGNDQHLWSTRQGRKTMQVPDEVTKALQEIGRNTRRKGVISGQRCRDGVEEFGTVFGSWAEGPNGAVLMVEDGTSKIVVQPASEEAMRRTLVQVGTQLMTRKNSSSDEFTWLERA